MVVNNCRAPIERFTREIIRSEGDYRVRKWCQHPERFITVTSHESSNGPSSPFSPVPPSLCVCHHGQPSVPVALAVPAVVLTVLLAEYTTRQIGAANTLGETRWRSL